MADYNAVCRTNYFRVTDEARLRDLIARCVSGEVIGVQLFQSKADKELFAFGCYSGLPSLTCEACGEQDGYNCDSCQVLCRELQKIVAGDDAIIITEVGNDKLRYLSASSLIITKKEIQVVQLDNAAQEAAGVMLNNPSYYTQMEY